MSNVFVAVNVVCWIAVLVTTEVPHPLWLLPYVPLALFSGWGASNAGWRLDGRRYREREKRLAIQPKNTFWNVKYRENKHDSWSGTPYRFGSQESAEEKARQYRADGFQAIVVSEDERRRGGDGTAGGGVLCEDQRVRFSEIERLREGIKNIGTGQVTDVWDKCKALLGEGDEP